MKEVDGTPVEGAPAEELLTLPPSGAALGRDPFAELAEPDPFADRLDDLGLVRGKPGSRRRGWAHPLRPARAPTPQREREARGGVRAPRSAPPTDGLRAARASEAKGAEPAPVRLRRRRWATTPSRAEIELPEPRGWLDRLLSENDRRMFAALSHLAEGEPPYDRYGFSPEVTKAAYLFIHALYRFYFRVRSEGHQNIPREGPALLVANHGGLLPFDAAMGITDVLLHTDPPRLARAIVDRWAGELPWINVFYARVGQVVGTRENFADLLEDGQLVLVFPEGIEGIRKPITQRYRLQHFRVGFVEQALRSRSPIIPMAFLGSDDQAPILYDIKPLARWMGLPVAPITPTFPWFGPLGLLPYPVSYRIVYGEPLRYHERFSPEGADDVRLVRYLTNQVRRAVQQLVDRSR